LESSIVIFFTGKSRSSADIIQQETTNVINNNQVAIEAMHQTKLHAYSMKEALLRGKISSMGEIMRQAWQQKKLMASSISNGQIDILYDLAMSEGAFCGKISGAGGGGFMMFLVDPCKKLGLIRALQASKSGEVYDCHFVRTGAEAWPAS
jgi:D-glycero-alpha-D-manno-heptose-7-phosphate kinase